jgi:Tol biopolymer transport system component
MSILRPLLTVALVAMGLIVLAILLTGGFSFTFLGIRISAYGLRNPLAIFLGLFIGRILAARRVSGTEAFSGTRRSWKKKGLMAGLLIVGALGIVFLLRWPEKETPKGHPFTEIISSREKQPSPALAGLTGRILFQSNRDGDEEIFVIQADGQGLKQLTFNRAFDGYPVWSPDGKRIAFESNRDGRFHLYVMDAEGRNPVRITSAPFDNRFPAWSPDGKRIAFESERDKGKEIYVVDLDSGKDFPLTDAWYKSTLPNWSPDGRRIAFTANRLGWGVYVVTAAGRDIRALDTEGGACRPHFSPDGTRIAYVSQKADGKGDIWIMKADGSEKYRLTTNAETYDYYPAWSPDGKKIAYASTLDKQRGNWEIYIIDATGGNPVRLTHHPAQDEFPDWR